MINDILDFSKVKAGQMTIDAHPIDASKVVRDAIQQMAASASNRALDIFMTNRDTPVQMVVDDRRLNQILINLISNAVKFTPTGGSITMTACQDEDGWTNFTVTDTGCGIAPGKIESIFEAYQQAGDAGSRAAGTGLGLALSRNFANLMGGTLKVESTLGVGSMFSLRLPTVFQAS